MSEAFKTTVVGSMPKPDWLMEQLPLNQEGKRQVRQGRRLELRRRPLKTAQDDATRLTFTTKCTPGLI